MAQDEDAPKGSSWHAWVRGSSRTRAVDVGETAGDAPTAEAAPNPSPAPPTPRSESADDDLDVQLRWPGADAPSGHVVDDDDEASDADDVAAVGPGGAGGHDASDDPFDGDDDDDLLPAVPLLPTIAGRVDALGALLRTIAMRVDSLGATTNAFRSAVSDRIDEYADVVAGLGRQADQNLEEYRRANERSVSELRRGLADHDELLNRAAARLDELATDIATLVDLVRLTANRGDAAPVLEAREGNSMIAEEVSALRADLHYVRDMLDIVVDTMPASAVGSGGGPLADADIDRIVARLAATVGGESSSKPPKPPKPSKPPKASRASMPAAQAGPDDELWAAELPAPPSLPEPEPEPAQATSGRRRRASRKK